MDNVRPLFGRTAFVCPHCSAYAAQRWFFTSGVQPSTIQSIYDDYIETEDFQKKFDSNQIAIANRTHELELENLFYSICLDKSKTQQSQESFPVANLYISECFNCHKIALWSFNKLIYPSTSIIPKNQWMPEDIQSIYDEANAILDASPRASAALLRLAIQELLLKLVEKDNGLNANIQELVTEGLIRQDVQQALDIVRITGNKAVHPGKIYDFDDGSVAERLFDLVNFIVEETIARPKKIDELYEKLPNEKKTSNKRKGQKKLTFNWT